MEEKARQNRQKLDNLPHDAGGRVKELSQYDFMDEEARRKFQDLLNKIRKHTMDSYAAAINPNLQNLDPAALSDMREMLKALNEMLVQRLRERSRISINSWRSSGITSDRNLRKVSMS